MELDEMLEDDEELYQENKYLLCNIGNEIYGIIEDHQVEYTGDGVTDFVIGADYYDDAGIDNGARPLRP